MHDLVIRGGTIVDGTGRPRFAGDVAIDGATITAVGADIGPGKREIDARGAIVAPGFVDIHTHYDGQSTWDTLMQPSSQHGVTSVVMGNCGVGFAPARRASEYHDFLIMLMEGVEDIPGTALHEGLPWDWETFPEYLDSVDSRPHKVDIGAQMPHAALRVFVMGERGSDHEQDPTPGEIEQMSRLTAEALEAGALGFASSRTINHRARDGRKIGSLTAKEEELLGIGLALKRTGKGVFQFTSDFRDPAYELGLLRRLSEECGRPLSVSLAQANPVPDNWRKVLDYIEGAAAEGVDMKAQVASRAIGLLLGLNLSLNHFMLCPSYKEIAGLPLKERVAAMRDPERRARIISEAGPGPRQGLPPAIHEFDRLFLLGDPPDYEQPAEKSIGARAAKLGMDPRELVYDLLLENDGQSMLYCPMLNYASGSLDTVHQMITSPRTLFGLSDGGAHVGIICDGSFPTFNLTHWARDRQRGEKLSLEEVVKGQAHDTARHVGWFDRGVLAPGYKADLNVIDFDGLRLHPPRVVFELPAGGRRLLQDVDGYRYTVCSGEVTFENGQPTEALPGRLVRGGQAAPA